MTHEIPEDTAMHTSTDSRKRTSSLLPRRHLPPSLGGAAILAVASLTAFGVAAQEFDLSWRTIDGGGGTSSGLDLTLTGTIGQADADTVLTGGSFQLEGGFWPGVSASPRQPACVGDLDHNGAVDQTDLAILLGAWNTGDADLDGDGITAQADIAILLGAWGACP
jgi:hypothetical protein